MTKDWSLTFRTADDMAFMLETVCVGWTRPPTGVRTADIAEVFTRSVAASNNGSSSLPAFYRLPPGAQIALRDGSSDVTFGSGLTKAALWLPPSGIPNIHNYGRAVAFPMLRLPAADPGLAAAECSRFTWLSEDRTVRRGMNQARMAECAYIEALCVGVTYASPTGMGTSYGHACAQVLYAVYTIGFICYTLCGMRNVAQHA